MVMADVRGVCGCDGGASDWGFGDDVVVALAGGMPLLFVLS